MTRRIPGLIIVLSMLIPLSACGESATSVHVVVTADPEVRARTAAVRLHVLGGVAPDVRETDETRPTVEGDWPLQAVIVPLGGDASRPLDVTLEAHDAHERTIARVRAAPVFEAGATRVVALHFEASCLGVLACGEGTTCQSGRCVPLPSDPDAGTPRSDGGTPRTDAGTRSDAGSSHSDAGNGRIDAGAPRPEIDAGPPCTPRTTYADADGDGYGDPTRAHESCDPPPSGYVDRAGDCDDACSACRPGGREVCEGARDEDCDGHVDQGCVCVVPSTRECPEGGNVCVRGLQTCLGDRWSECVGRIEGRDERCNALDDDCDGRTDEDLRRGCGHGCHSYCELGVWGPCRKNDGDRCDDERRDDERDDDD